MMAMRAANKWMNGLLPHQRTRAMRREGVRQQDKLNERVKEDLIDFIMRYFGDAAQRMILNHCCHCE